jgi:DNA-binding NarL/FixJ family response regulator
VATTNLFIYCQNNLQRAAWLALLEKQPGLSVRGTAANWDDVNALPKTNGQTAVLIDLSEPLPSQISQLTETHSTYGLLCLVDSYDLEQIVNLLRLGVTGILSRDATVPELTQALVAAGRGEIVLPPSLAARALSALARGDIQTEQNIETLTEREQEVLALLAKGMTNKDIAQSLFLSVRTIEAHLRNIYGKLDVTTRTEAVLWAVQHGFES